MTEVDVFIRNFTLVDPEIYQLWIEGHTGNSSFHRFFSYYILIVVSEAVRILIENGLGKETGATVELMKSDVLDHYRTYSMLEKLLNNPNNLQDQLIFQIDPETRTLLIEK